MKDELDLKKSMILQNYFEIISYVGLPKIIEGYINKQGYGDDFVQLYFQDFFYEVEAEYKMFEANTLMLWAKYPAVHLPNQEDLEWIMSYRYFYEQLEEYIKNVYNKKYRKHKKEVAELMKQLYVSFELDQE